MYLAMCRVVVVGDVPLPFMVPTVLYAFKPLGVVPCYVCMVLGVINQILHANT